ncbi:MAG: 30S ribosomal protein S5 [Patescibacteria group bacterium]
MAQTKRTKRNTPREQSEFDQRIIDLARVTRVTAGGKRMRFRACVVIGDKKGQVGYGIAKGADVTLAVNKAANHAKKALVTIPITNGTIPHEVRIKYKAAHLMLKSAPEGTGVMAGGPIRLALEVSGISNIVAKIYGSKNKVNNIHAFFEAIKELSLPSVKMVSAAKTTTTSAK